MAEAERGDIVKGESADLAVYRAYPDWLKQRLDRFQDRKFGLFVHWGIYTQWGCIESWPLSGDAPWARPETLEAWTERGQDIDRFRADYRRLNETFSPGHFDPHAWAALAAEAGMRYVCFTTKHHDGFCLWDTRTTGYRSTHPDCPFHADARADAVRAVWDAFRARDMAVSCYFSKSDWHCPWYWRPGRPPVDRNPNYDTAEEPEAWERFVRFVHAQVEELMSRYGPVDALWLDGGQVRAPAQDIRMDEMVAMARRRQPGLIVADRCVGGEHENILTPEQEIPDAPPGRPWESCLTLGKGWAYERSETFKPARQVIHMLCDIAAKGGNFLLNVGPDPDGLIPAGAQERLRAIGAWLRINGEAIYASRPIAPYLEGRIRYTRRGETLYAIALAGDETPTTVTLRALQPPDNAPVWLLGHPRPLLWRRADAATVVDLPAPLPGEHAWTLRFSRAE